MADVTPPKAQLTALPNAPKFQRPTTSIDWIVPVLLLIAAVGVSIFKIWQSGEHVPTQTELALYDAITLLLGVLGSLALGTRLGAKSERDEMRRLIGPHGRSAFRRATSIFVALTRFDVVVRELRDSLSSRSNDDGFIDAQLVDMAMQVIRTQVGEQILAANHAMEDWRDVVPEDVEAIEGQARGEIRK